MTRPAQIALVFVLLADSLLLAGCGGGSSNNRDVGIPDGPSVVGGFSDATGTAVDAAVEDAVAPEEGPSPVAEWACGTQICHTGQVCMHATAGAVGFPNPDPYCVDLAAGCSNACDCVCRSRGGMCEWSGSTDIGCGMP